MPNEPVSGYWQPTTNFNKPEVRGSTSYDQSRHNRTAGDDTWYPATRREDGTWDLTALADDMRTSGSGDEDNSAATRYPNRHDRSNLRDRQRPRTDANRRCFNCSSESHLRRNCPAGRKDQGQTSQMNYSATGRHENHQNAKSFYARASINNHQCLCLVDSGAESNLLPARYATDVRLRQSDKTLFAANGS